jgi:DNA-binding beta-propeller fold protein YncE
MKRVTAIGFGVCVAIMLTLGGCQEAPEGSDAPANAPAAPQPSSAAGDVPMFEFDPTWPKMPLPNQWLVGSVAGVYVDAEDHIWIVHRPRALLHGHEDDASYAVPESECCKPAPSVIEFDQAGHVVQAWGGPGPEYEWREAGPGRRTPPTPGPSLGYDWPESEHSIFVNDDDQTVWLSNSGGSHIVKFTRAGEFLLQIGRKGQRTGSHNTENLGAAAGLVVDPKTNELYVADGYRNRRVIVFDADTGAYKRHWGAYGNPPDDSIPFRYDPDGPRSQQFNTVHCVQLSRDDLVYVCDRANNRIQVFRTDGTFVKEGLVAPWSLRGAPMDIAFSTDAEQRFVYVADGRNEKVWILRREDLEVIGSFGHGGHWGGGFTVAHGIAADASGNIYVAEVTEGKRVQRFTYMGLGTSSTGQ